MRKFLAVCGFYVIVAVLITWPMVTTFDTRFLGHPFGDVYEYVRHSWWIKHALQTGQPLFFQPLLGYPDGLSGGWLWANPLQSFPVWLLAFGLSLPAAFNLAVLMRLALNGWALHLLIHDLTGRREPALLAGLIFMLYPTFQGQLAIGHTGLLLLWPVPLYIYALRRVQGDSPGGARPARWIILAGGLLAVSLWGNMLLLIYLVGPVTLWMLARPLLARRWPGLRRTLLAVILGGLIASIFIVPFLIEEQSGTTNLSEGGDVRYSADLLTLVTPSFYHPLFGRLAYTGRVLGIDPFERMGYVGIVAGLLALVGAWRRPDARGWLALGALAWVFSLGALLKVLDTVVSVNLGEQVSYITLPWLLFQDLPLINVVRTPARFDFTVALAVAVLAGYGAAWLWDRLKGGRWPIFAALMLLVIFEYQSFWPFPTIPGTVPEAVQALAERGDVRAVFNLPWEHLLAQKDGMFLQTGHHKALIAGHVTRRTPVDPARLTILETTLDPALLEAAGADILIVHKQWAQDAAALQARIPGDLLYEDARIAVYEVAPPSGPPQFTALADDDPSIEARGNSYLFAPEPGWTTLTGQLQAGGRDVALLLDGQRIHRWQGAGVITLDVPIPVATGYHTITLALEPPCPQNFAPTLRCRSVQVESLNFGNFAPGTLPESVPFAGGVTLAGYALDVQAVNLWWLFDRARSENDIRFVHVVDSTGTMVAQDDRTLGVQPGGSAWAEQVAFGDLPPGTYDVYAGWYTYPDLTRFPVLAAVPGAPDGWVRLGQITVGEPQP